MSQRLRRHPAAIIEGHGQLHRKATVFDITAKTLTAADVDGIDAQEYISEAIEPVVVVRNRRHSSCCGKRLRCNIQQQYRQDATEARAVVKGKGYGYQGTVTKLFEICGAKHSISGCDRNT
ncbi:MAG: hypothetical protein ACLTDF_04925 [Coprococcus sp.]